MAYLSSIELGASLQLQRDNVLKESQGCYILILRTDLPKTAFPLYPFASLDDPCL